MREGKRAMQRSPFDGRAGTTGGRLLIFHETTADDSNGPWPPPGDDWIAVAHFNGATWWRRLSLTRCLFPPRRRDAGGAA
jgi:hypothetical protein